MSPSVQKYTGKKKEHQPKLLGSDMFRWGGGLPREGVGAKRRDTSLETQVKNPFGGSPGILAGISWGRPKSLRKQKFVLIWPLT